MGNGIYVALSGAVAQANAFDVAANNVANAGTTGFRAERVRFQEALSRAQRHDAGYVEVAGTVIDPHVGAITTTGNPLDLALTADGHFVVDTPQGVRYTRAGNFRLDAAGTMVSPRSIHALAPSAGGSTRPACFRPRSVARPRTAPLVAGVGAGQGRC